MSHFTKHGVVCDCCPKIEENPTKENPKLKGYKPKVYEVGDYVVSTPKFMRLNKSLLDKLNEAEELQEEK